MKQRIILLGLIIIALAYSYWRFHREGYHQYDLVPIGQITLSATATLIPTFTPTATETFTPPPTATISLEQAQHDLTKLLDDDTTEIKVLPLKATSAMWVVYSAASTDSGEIQAPFVGLYHQSKGAWQEIDTYYLDETEMPYHVSVAQIENSSKNIWLTVDSIGGTHNSCFYILNFDGQSLSHAYSDCQSHVGIGKLSDIDSDGESEIIIDQTNDYIFRYCYVCQMRYFSYEVLQIQQGNLVKLTIEPLPNSAETQLRQLNHRAIELTQAKLWKQAQETINQALLLDKHNKIVQQNAHLIKLYADSFASQAKNNRSYPLLGNVFYGDYAAAVQMMRPYSITAIFDPQTPLIKGSLVENYQPDLAYAITTTVASALQAEPNLAEAYFLRAWATHLITPTHASILADLRQAVRLTPQDPLFRDSLTYFAKK